MDVGPILLRGVKFLDHSVQYIHCDFNYKCADVTYFATFVLFLVQKNLEEIVTFLHKRAQWPSVTSCYCNAFTFQEIGFFRFQL